MLRDDVYSHIQSVFRRGLVTTIGSGLAAAMGLPTMADLGRHLADHIPPRLTGLSSEAIQDWDGIAARLAAGADLETAMSGMNSINDLLPVLADETAQLIGAAEATVIARILTQPTVEPLAQLLTYIMRTNQTADVITTNYDRLVEVCAAQVKIRVDTLFYGHTVGRFDEALSRNELLRPSSATRNAAGVQLSVYDRIRLSKPHGSLDWFLINGECIRAPFNLAAERRIITPGSTKYRVGYAVPFDAHRKRATDALDSAAAMLFLGYGFNDEHLQTHLAPDRNLPTVIIARTLSPNAIAFIERNTNAVGLEAETVTGVPGTRATRSTGSCHLAGTELWKLDVLNQEVLGL